LTFRGIHHSALDGEFKVSFLAVFVCGCVDIHYLAFTDDAGDPLPGEKVTDCMLELRTFIRFLRIRNTTVSYPGKL